MTAPPIDVSTLSKTELMKLERDIARRHSGQFPWEILLWAFGNMACWLCLWPLVILGYLPLWAAFPIATVTITLVYLPTHEAQHDIIARPGTRWRWLNELVGHATSWMIVSPFAVLRYTHLEHHKHANDPALDPDHTTHADSAWHAVRKIIRESQPDGQRSRDYAACLARGNRKDLILQSIGFKMTYFAILFTLAWSGLALEAFFLWWLPLQIGLVYVALYLSWAPHHPAKETGRYRDTRSFRSRLGNIGSMGMQFHIVHHLHPYIPLTRTPAAYWEMRPILEARGCNIHEL